MLLNIFPRKLVYLSGIILTILSCKKEVAPPPVPTGPVTRQETNNWILDSMRYYYLWNDQLPAKVDSQTAPIDLFRSLRVSTDSLSALFDTDDLGNTVHKDFLHAYGFNYSIISVDGIAQPLGIVKFVIPGTAPDLNGLHRGDYFTRINGKQLTAHNPPQLEKELMDAPNGTITKATINGNTVTDADEIFVENRLLLENPLYVHKIWNVGNKKVGYIFYNYFEDYFDDDLVKAFTGFKTNNVSELIIDLRYNPGGSLTATAVLSALTAPGINEKSVFIRYQGNSNLRTQSASFEQVLAVPSSEKFVSFSDLTPGRLSLKRVFILTTALTASASEAVINNLKAYMQVVTIGERTYGKDKGAVIIKDLREPQRITWTLFPITYILKNAQGQGNYDKGINPDHSLNELSVLPLVPVGDSTDLLITKAISIISGNGRTVDLPARPAARIHYDSRRAASEHSVLIIPH